LVVLATHSTDCSTDIIIRGWYNRPVVASVIEDSAPVYSKNEKKKKKLNSSGSKMEIETRPKEPGNKRNSGSRRCVSSKRLAFLQLQDVTSHKPVFFIAVLRS
jgi:hypothetical protein